MIRMTAAQAAALVRTDDTLLIGGSGCGHAVPDALLAALGARYRESGEPRDLTIVHPVGLGDGKARGVGHLAQDGLLKRVVTGTYVDSPGEARMALDEKFEAYNLPQGVMSQLMREMAAGRPGLMTKVGLHTFVDPRLEGGRQNRRATEDLVEHVQFRGEDYLFYKPFHVDIVFVRGSAADEDGNISMEHEAVTLEMLSMAQAARRCGGLVVAQVRQVVPRGSLHPKMVKIPGILVDVLVVDPDQWQTFVTQDNPAYSGHLRVNLLDIPRLPAGPRRVIARRGAMELFQGAICNLGSGISTGIANVAAEEGVLDRVCLTNEQGNIGGAPSSREPGAALSPDAQIDQPYQFDFYDGGGLDLAFLSFAEFDAAGNVNVSRFNGRLVGPGGFINISQGAGKVVFGGTLSAGGVAKAVARVEQVTFSGDYARECGQRILYVTERAVFQLGAEGPELIEIAPGMDLQADIMAAMGFRPRIAPALKVMDAALFGEGPMGLAARLPRHPPRAALARLSGG
ncbi:MAG: CoA-transferase [Devosia sp.]|nr:CoA-transferase [Devosia sp.]